MGYLGRASRIRSAEVPQNKSDSPVTNGSRGRVMAPMSLRMRFAFGIGAVLLPVLLLAAASSVASRTTLSSFEKAASSASKEAIPLAGLKAQLLVARAASYDEVLDGEPGFEGAAADVERSFDKLRGTEGFDDNRALVRSAQRSWNEARDIVESAAALPSDQRFVEMENAAVFYRSAEEDLAAAEQAAIDEQNEKLADARALDTRTQRTAIVLLCAAIIAGIIAAFSLLRSLLRPLDALKQG